MHIEQNPICGVHKPARRLSVDNVAAESIYVVVHIKLELRYQFAALQRHPVSLNSNDCKSADHCAGLYPGACGLFRRDNERPGCGLADQDALQGQSACAWGGNRFGRGQLGLRYGRWRFRRWRDIWSARRAENRPLKRLRSAPNSRSCWLCTVVFRLIG
jgi:hypothetical protein